MFLPVFAGRNRRTSHENQPRLEIHSERLGESKSDISHPSRDQINTSLADALRRVDCRYIGAFKGLSPAPSSPVGDIGSEWLDGKLRDNPIHQLFFAAWRVETQIDAAQAQLRIFLRSNLTGAAQCSLRRVNTFLAEDHVQLRREDSNGNRPREV